MIVGVIGGGQLGRMLALAGIPLGLSLPLPRPGRRCARRRGRRAPRRRLRRPRPARPARRRRRRRHVRVRERAGRGRAPRRRRARPGGARGGAGPPRREAALPPARDPDCAHRRRGRVVPRAPEDPPARLRRQGPAAGRDPSGVRPRARPRGARPFDRELSLLAVRAATARRASTRSSRTCTRTASCAPRGRRRSTRRRRLPRTTPRRLLEELDYVGVLALELFETRRRAARQRARAARAQHRPLDDRGRGDEPVREPPPRGARPAARARPTCARESAMLNLIGDAAAARGASCAVPGAHLHLYGKAPRPGPQARPRDAARADAGAPAARSRISLAGQPVAAPNACDGDAVKPGTFSQPCPPVGGSE